MIILLYNRWCIGFCFAFTTMHIVSVIFVFQEALTSSMPIPSTDLDRDEFPPVSTLSVYFMLIS